MVALAGIPGVEAHLICVLAEAAEAVIRAEAKVGKEASFLMEVAIE